MGFTWQGHPPEQLLIEHFSVTTGFRPGQREIIEALVQGNCVLAIQHTGWGKSLCYQMASLYFPYLTIVFSPLKALMRDQCQRCNARYSIPSAIISSDFSEEENRTILEQAVTGQLKMLFIAPERLSNTLWQSYVLRMRISMIVIDEAHCISTWGHDFRPHYRRIVRLLDAIPDHIPVLGLTATANKRVEADILQQMGKNVRVIRGTMQRPNLYVQVVHRNGDREKLAYLAETLPHCPGTGIVYTATKKDAEMVAAFLSQQGFTSEYYHSNRDDEVRQDIERKLMANQYKVICSTNALGMGIDKRDVRFIMHYHIPASPIHYYQEMGRAGRDGKVAWCILLYDPQDLNIQNRFISGAKPAGTFYEIVLSLFRASPYGLCESDIARSTGFTRSTVQTLLMDLEDQGFIERNPGSRTYVYTHCSGTLDFSVYDSVREQKIRELNDIQKYALWGQCYMGYLNTYLGDQPGYVCGTCGCCQPKNFPFITPAQRIQEAVGYFLDRKWLPRINKSSGTPSVAHEHGQSLAYDDSGRSAITYTGKGSTEL